MKNISTKSEKKFQKVMDEFGKGEFKSHDKPVKNQKQALAIAFSEARKIYPNYGIKREGGNTEDKAVKAIFYLDSIEDKTFPGYTFGEDWNGFSVPYFEKEQADRIMEALGGEYKDDTYTFDDGYGGEEEYEKQTIDTVDGKKIVYPIGAYNWTWGEESKEKMVNGGITGSELEKIYKTGTAKQLWEAWPNQGRIHFLIDHATEFFELMGDDFYKSSDAFSTLTYDALPSPIRKSVVVHHAQGMYADGGGISDFFGKAKRYGASALKKSKELASKGYEEGKKGYSKAKEYTRKQIHDQKKKIALDVLDETRDKVSNKDESRHVRAASNIVEDQYQEGSDVNGTEYAPLGNEPLSDGGNVSKLSPVKKKLLKRINTLKGTLQNASPGAQKAIQKKIDVLQKRFDYNPSAKERAMANKGKFALDVPTKYRQFIYKKLWGMKIFPRIHTLNGTSSIVVNNKINLDKAYRIYSDMLKEKGETVSALSKISRKL